MKKTRPMDPDYSLIWLGLVDTFQEELEVLLVSESRNFSIAVLF